MTETTLRVRRATVEDLAGLRSMWESMRLPVAELEPRLTEFQVVEDAEGKLVGGIRFQINGSQARLHNEGFINFGLADAARELFWKRIQTLATNHGVFRLWMQESTPFWIRLGFTSPAPDELKKLPAEWNNGAPWVTLQLKNEDVITAAEKELSVFMSAQKHQSDRTLEQMRALKALATIFAIIFALCAFGAAFYLLVQRHQILHAPR